MAKIIFHIGMGKTGTSAIQKKLEENIFDLRTLGAEYLGLYDFLPEEFKDIAKQHNFYTANELVQEKAAHRLIEHIRDLSIHRKYIISNESLWGYPLQLQPFFKTLVEDPEIDIEFVGFLRNPDDWLKSAYQQWGIVDKSYYGKLASYKDKASELFQAYHACYDWLNTYHEKVKFISYDNTNDVVKTFLNHCELALDVSEPDFFYSTASREELLFRALYNDLCEGPASPDEFENASGNILQDASFKKIEDLEQFCFDTSSLFEIIDLKKDMFEYIKTNCQIDLLSSIEQLKGKEKQNAHVSRNNIVFYLMLLVTQLLHSNQNLRQRLSLLEDKIGQKAQDHF